MGGELLDELLDIEQRLASGDGDTYRSILLPEAIVIVPGARMGLEDTAAAIDAGQGWDRFALTEPQLATVADARLLTYTFDGVRGEDVRYRALMSSLYVCVDDRWRLAFHQQTPLEPTDPS
jgi:hypothetical protein